MSDRTPSRRQFLMGSAAGTLLLAAGGCGHRTARGEATTTPPLERQSADLPQYSRLAGPDAPPEPPEILAGLQSPLLMEQAKGVFGELLSPGRRPSADQALFFTIDQNHHPVAINAPSGDQCLLFFTSIFGAADYKRLLLRNMPSLAYGGSNAQQVLSLLRQAESTIPLLVVDRCPRCAEAAVLHTSALRTPEDVVRAWAVFMSTKKARSDLYLAIADKARDEGNFERARDVALLQIAFVTPDDLRAHRLLLDVATRLGDATLHREAEAYLSFLHNNGVG